MFSYNKFDYIIQGKSINEWIKYFNNNIGRKCLHIVLHSNGNVTIKTDAMCQGVYVTIFDGHYSTFEDLINSMKFFSLFKEVDE